MKIKYLLGVALGLNVSFAMAGTIILKQNTQTYKPNSMGALKEFTLVEEKKKTTLSGGAVSYSTDVRFVLKTKTVAEIANFGIVQYIKGCQYNSEYDGQEVTKYFGISRNYFDEIVTFQHKNWQIDSDSHDPVYTSWMGNRTALFRWNINQTSYDPETSVYMAQKLPPHPTVFATDLPGSSNVDGQTAKNSSLEFEVCLFNISDLPARTTPNGLGVDRSKALKCFSWDSKFVYDFSKKKFQMSGPIDPFCFTDKQ